MSPAHVLKMLTKGGGGDIHIKERMLTCIITTKYVLRKYNIIYEQINAGDKDVEV